MDYYNPEDLKRFPEVGEFREDLMDKFFEYYNSATAEEGALTKREKALIALAVAHTEKCPYCIDAYTTQCLETGADPEQMTEAVHVRRLNVGRHKAHPCNPDAQHAEKEPCPLETQTGRKAATEQGNGSFRRIRHGPRRNEDKQS